MKIFANFLLNNLEPGWLFLMISRCMVVLLRSPLTIDIYDGYYRLNKKYYIPSAKRVKFYLRGLPKRASRIEDEYLLSGVSFNNEDLVVDCGANAGDLLLALEKTQLKLKYIGFEPGSAEFFCLEKNMRNFPLIDSCLYDMALSDKSGFARFYVNTDHADNSLVKIEKYSQSVTIRTVRLDEILHQVKNIALLKLEAEGYEPEILEGARGILEKIRYISVDVGFERGVAMQSTLPQVTNFLLSHGFKLIDNGRKRHVLLFQSKAHMVN